MSEDSASSVKRGPTRSPPLCKNLAWCCCGTICMSNTECSGAFLPKMPLDFCKMSDFSNAPFLCLLQKMSMLNTNNTIDSGG